MLEQLLQLDRDILIFLNNLGSEKYDFLWLIITKQANWTPFFLLLAFLIYKKSGWKNLLLIIVFVAALLTVGNEIVEASKQHFQRLRPCNNVDINTLLRVVKPSKSFSFFSGHATNSISAMLFLFLILKKHYRYAYLVFLYPLIFAYSRIYLGVHYPTDILTGYAFGAALGYLFYCGYCYVNKKYFLNYNNFSA